MSSPPSPARIGASAERYDAVVIGGGFYGCEIALMLRRLGHARIAVVEREPAILRRASFVNQARVHHGYHYPRSLATADGARRHYVRFLNDYAEAIRHDMEHVYAVGRGSKVSADQFARFCERIGAPCVEAPAARRQLFAPEHVEAVFSVRELAFDARKLADRLHARLAQAGIDLKLGCEARFAGSRAGLNRIETSDGALTAPWVFNCTYANLAGAGVDLQALVKMETAEIALIEPPRALAGLGVTVIDGPFFSTMPLPAMGLHSLTHVRFTPHSSLGAAITAQADLPQRSRAVAMQRDASRFLPILAQATLKGSLYELKAVLHRNEDDDGRPILIERSRDHPGVWSILGAKLDNIYDVHAYFTDFDWVS
jgi:glycine/D-amino acid oxidase-like deaminating enzyme